MLAKEWTSRACLCAYLVYIVCIHAKCTLYMPTATCVYVCMRAYLSIAYASIVNYTRMYVYVLLHCTFVVWGVCLRLHVCLYVFMYMCVHACASVYLCVCVIMRVYACLCTSVCTSACLCICAWSCVCTSGLYVYLRGVLLLLLNQLTWNIVCNS